MFENLFASYAINPGNNALFFSRKIIFINIKSFILFLSVFQELPGDLTYSELQFYSQYQYQDLHYQGTAKNFAWLTGQSKYQII